MERVKCIDKIKNAVVLEKVGEGRTVLDLINKRKDAPEGMVNGKKVRGKRRY